MATEMQLARYKDLNIILQKQQGRLEPRAIFRLWSDIDEYMSYQFQRFTELLLMHGIKECLVVINSPGGNLFDSISMIENVSLLQFNGIQVRTCVRGLAGSGGALVFLAGNPRGMAASSWIYVHRLSFPSKTRVALDAAQKDARDYATIMNSVEERVSQNTKIPLRKVKRAFRNSSWISAEQALSEGWCTVIAP